VVGYNYLHGPEPVMLENDLAAAKPVAFFGGVRGAEGAQNLYLLRAYYGLFATLLAPLCGVSGALVVVNWLAWALCAWVAWRLSMRLFDDPLAALLAVTFVAGGMGMTVHIGDYSAHLLSFASYSLGVYLLYSSGVLFARQPLRTHLMLGAYLAVANLVYSNGLMLTAVYLLTAMRHNARRHLAAAVLLAVTARPLWKATLGLLGARVPDTEAELFMGALGRWGGLIHEPWSRIVGRVTLLLTEFTFFDSPVVVALGLFACCYLPRRPAQRWFGAAVLGVPLLMLLAWLESNWSRGYLIYGDWCVWVYCWLGGLLANGLRAGRGLRLAAVLGLCLSVGSHFAWSTAHFWHALGPVKAYMEGWQVGGPYFRHPRTEVVSMTGLEPTPALSGGGASLVEAGAWNAESEARLDPGAVAFGAACGRRLLPFAYLGLWVAALVPSGRRRLLACGAVLAAVPLSAYLSTATLRGLPVFFNYHSSLVLPPGAGLNLRAALSPSFRDKLRSAAGPNDRLVLYVPQWMQARDPVRFARVPVDFADVSVMAGSTPVPVDPNAQGYPREPTAYPIGHTPSAVEALAGADCLTIKLVNASEEPIPLGGWQRQGLPGRELELMPAAEAPAGQAPVLPAIELRLVRPDGSIKLIGF
jgi:hypothetical protein